MVRRELPQGDLRVEFGPWTYRIPTQTCEPALGGGKARGHHQFPSDRGTCWKLEYTSCITKCKILHAQSPSMMSETVHSKM
ncbi:hypothetical protein AV530_015190 [Patagioenas fasciata monilis]|uniref:Uncharacterized protein n=1 Tax=Patagioenas fasciata monilis TaxID=372326 RepID=A0A1V4K1I5_PATFA|nr:hypothetical protein AV530_015190 [Patagioenas fasciata monilis]